MTCGTFLRKRCMCCSGHLPNLPDLGNRCSIWEDDRAPWKLRNSPKNMTNFLFLWGNKLETNVVKCYYWFKVEMGKCFCYIIFYILTLSQSYKLKSIHSTLSVCSFRIRNSKRSGPWQSRNNNWSLDMSQWRQHSQVVQREVTEECEWLLLVVTRERARSGVSRGAQGTVSRLASCSGNGFPPAVSYSSVCPEPNAVDNE